MASLVLGLIGRKRSGKDTFAARLAEAHGFTRLALADPLRDFSYALDPIVDEGVVGPFGYPAQRLSQIVDSVGWELAKDEYPEVRRTLQRLGTEAGRSVLGENVWVDALARRVDEVEGPVVVTDVRFPNEAGYVTGLRRGVGTRYLEDPAARSYDRIGRTVRITRPGLPTDDLHASETALDDWRTDYVASNLGSIADLHRAADAVARQVL